MSDVMSPIPFAELLHHMLEEYRLHGTVFGVEKLYREDGELPLELFGRPLALPFGCAAGPHTQLAQNLAAIYAGGARFLELKTVQTLYGEDLNIPRPCIRAEDEGYNVEWSSEFSPQDALNEYVKGWFLCKVLATELELGDPDGFQFPMSCGYNLEGLKEASVDQFIEGLKDASDQPVYQACVKVLEQAI